MLQTLSLDGFRSYADPTTIPLAPLTVLAGSNNVGKSSVIAALAALAQSAERGGGPDLALRGGWVGLGRFQDVVNTERSRDDMSFSIGLGRGGSDAIDVAWTFGEPIGSGSRKAGEDGRYTARLAEVEVVTGEDAARLSRLPDGTFISRRKASGGTPRPTRMPDVGTIQQSATKLGALRSLDLLGPALRDLRYLSAYRAAPRTMFEARESSLGPPLGRAGEHAAEYLFTHRDQMCDVLPNRDAAPCPLLKAVNRWSTHVFSASIRMSVNEVARIGYTLDIETPGADRLSLEMVGLGVSQTLPILPLVLSSAPGELVAVETPEAHLHPGAQHRLAHLFVQAVRRGRQVIVETHSEHVVNAIRLAVKSGALAPEQVALLFFEQHEGVTGCTRIDLDRSGRALAWPEGFFDQAAKDLAELL